VTRPRRDIAEHDPAQAHVGFDLEPAPTPPTLPGTVVVKTDIEDLAGALLADLLIHAQNCVRAFGDFHLALSGGSTPLPLYMRLMTDPLYRSFPWKFTHLWLVDERRVPLDDDRSNFRHLREIIADHADMPKGNVHPIDAERDDAANRYERDLKQTLAWRERGHDRLDFVLLGCGEDGHTASLFPHSTALNETARLVAINDGPTVTPPPRVTMTYPLLNAARFITILVTGAKKRAMIEQLEAAHHNASPGNPPDHAELPILNINPIGGTLKWFLDEPACPVRA
jgi:6-phosphogluconolactonase